MALTHTLNSHSYDGRYLQVSLTQTKDAANRRSKITGTVTTLAGSYTWYSTGPTTVKVAGTQRYSRARESNGNGQSTRNFSGTISEFYVSHDSAGNASVSVEIITAIYASAAQTRSNTWTLDSIGPATTACRAPTALSVNNTIAEGDVTLSWSGAADGTNNSISSYEIQYSDSANNSTWGDWVALATVTTTAASGSRTVSPPSTRGNFRRFQVRTRGSAGSSYYSSWKVSSNSVRKNTWPNMPTAAAAAPANYSGETITLSWSGASGGTSSIKGYQIASRTSTDNLAWGSWTVLAVIDLAASSGSYTPAVSRTPGTYTQFGIWTIDALDVYSGEKISNSIYCNITATGAPTSLSVGATLSEGNVTLSWSGAVSGAGNAISSYEIQYSESTDGSAWGDWTALTTVASTSTSGSASVAPPATRGSYRRFQIRTRGAAGASYYSGWKISSNSVRRNILPTAPSSFTVSPAIFQSGELSFSWSGAAAGTSTIKNYVLQISTSNDNSTWGAWTSLATVTTTATSGSYSYSPGAVAAFTRYRICATDTLDCISAYRTSNTVRKNNPPPTPTVVAPKAGATIYNTQPRILVTMGTEPDGERQILCVKTTSGIWEDYGGLLNNNASVIYRHEALSPGNHSVSVKAKDEGVQAESSEVSRSFSVAASPFDKIIPGETRVKAAHIATLRTAVNNVRAYYGLTAYAWTEDIVPGKTQIKNWTYHIIELRKAVEQIVAFINSFDAAITFDVPVPQWLPITPGRPKAAVMEQLAELITQL